MAPRNIAAPFIAGVISAAGYYLAEGILFGSFVAPVASLAGSAGAVRRKCGDLPCAGAAAMDKARVKDKTQGVLHRR